MIKKNRNRLKKISKFFASILNYLKTVIDDELSVLDIYYGQYA
ncbi:MAG: hypothetical protein PHO70_07125 [Candidatus Omnitrophica bacterium]|nr:hypothetical protein [Candidatus Omnitrophota bacterium]